MGTKVIEVEVSENGTCDDNGDCPFYDSEYSMCNVMLLVLGHKPGESLDKFEEDILRQNVCPLANDEIVVKRKVP